METFSNEFLNNRGFVETATNIYQNEDVNPTCIFTKYPSGEYGTLHKEIPEGMPQLEGTWSKQCSTETFDKAMKELYPNIELINNNNPNNLEEGN